MDDLDSLGGRLRFARELAHLHMTELSALADLSQAHVGQLERGVSAEPRAGTLIAVAEVLGISLDWLMMGRGKAPTARAVIAALYKFREEHPERVKDRAA